jgi:hypothetical protein
MNEDTGVQIFGWAGFSLLTAGIWLGFGRAAALIFLGLLLLAISYSAFSTEKDE